jgi:hypothetical protein
MNKNYFFILCTILLFSACKEKEITYAKGDIWALCYNVAGLPAGISSSLPTRNLVLISPLINEFDIVHVQEDFCYHDSLLLHNTHNTVTTPIPCIGDGLNTFTNYKIKEFERVAWTDCTAADCLSMKGFTYSKIEVEKGVTIDFYNIHCNAGSEIASIDARRANMKQFLAYMLPKSANEAVIIMGDFNQRYTRVGDTLAVLLDLGFTDPWISLVRNNVVPVNGDPALQGCSPSFSVASCEIVDKAFYRSSEEISLQATYYQYSDDLDFFYEGDLSQPLSDHEPLQLKIEYEFNKK